MKSKFSLGQQVIFSSYNSWIGDYAIKATVIGFGDYFLNGTQTYKLKTINDDIFNNVCEIYLLEDPNNEG